MKAFLRLSIGSALAVIACASCSQNQEHPAPAKPASNAAGNPSHVDVSRVKTYTDMRSLTEDSIATVDGVAQQSKQVTIGGVDFTVSEVKVTAVKTNNAKSGPYPTVGSIIRVRQTTMIATGKSGMDAEVLHKGTRYVLYLQPFWLTDPQHPVPNEYVITGGQAGWTSGGGNSFAQAQSSSLPASLDVDARATNALAVVAVR